MTQEALPPFFYGHMGENGRIFDIYDNFIGICGCMLLLEEMGFDFKLFNEGNVGMKKLWDWKKIAVTAGLWVAAILLCAHQLGMFRYAWNMSFTAFVDGDCYMHMLRVVSMEVNHSFSDGFMHWTKPFDFLLWIGASAGAPWYGFFKAAHWWGVVVSPILGVMTVGAMMWAVNPYIRQNGWGRVLPFRGSEKINFAYWKICMLVLSLQMVVFWEYSRLSRPDHHSLLSLLFAVILGFLFRVIEKRDYKYCVGLGLVTAFAMWVSVESLAAVAMINLSMLALWVLKENKEIELGEYATRACDFSRWLLLGVVLALFIERPLSGLFAIEYDKISMIHVFICFLGYIYWLGLSVCSIKTVKMRIAAGIGAGLVAAAAMYGVFPTFFKGPFAMVDPTVKDIWLNHVSEVSPLFWDFSRQSIGLAVNGLGMALIAVPYALRMIYVKRKEMPNYWIVFRISFLIFFTLAAFQRRWTPYIELVLFFPVILAVYEVLDRPRWWKLKNKYGLMVAKVLMVVVLALLPSFVGKMVVFLHMPNAMVKMKQQQRHARSDIASLPFLRQINDEHGEQTILTWLDYGPEIMYGTSNCVIATPYHRNSEGILCLYHVMTAETDDEALALIKKYDITMVVMYPESSERLMYLKTNKADTFYKRFLKGEYPEWLTPIEVPEKLKGSCYIFSVKK